MKKVFVLLLALACLGIFAGCGCQHEWEDATCTAPRRCKICGEGEGETLGHSWEEATCTTVKTCTRCGRTQGDPLGHNWVEATCTEPKTCQACGEKLGSSLGHTWVEATTDAPKTCSICNATEGERIVTDSRFTTENTKDLWGRWEAAVDLSEDDLSVFHYNGNLKGTYWMEFGNAGELTAGFVLENEEEFRKAMAEYTADFIYDKVEEKQISEETANTVVEALLDVNVERYFLDLQKDTPAEELVEKLLAESKYGSSWIGTFVYCMEDGKLYIDTEWKEELTEVPCEFIGTTMLIDSFLEFKKADPA